MIDLHVHTIYSDGKNTIEEMIQTALKMGLKKIAITDHIWRSSDWFDNYYNEIINLRKKYSQIEILVGFEAKALSINGEIDATLNICKKADIRNGAIHRIPFGNIMDKYLSREDIKKNNDKAYHNWLVTTKNLIKNRYVDIIVHPCMVLNKYNLNYKKEDIYSLFLLAKEYNKKLEISTRYKKANNFLWDVLYDNPNFISYISYGSDSHSTNELIKAHSGK